jgi:ketosteroid isomerase-like protein
VSKGRAAIVAYRPRPGHRSRGDLVMGEHENRKVIERLIQCINDQQVELMDELFHEDAVMDWPQSGEQIVGGDNRRAVYQAFPRLPVITARRMLAAGDLVVAEASLDYGGPTYLTVFIFEFRAGMIARETAYWAEPFDAPDWRAQWVTPAGARAQPTASMTSSETS